MTTVYIAPDGNDSTGNGTIGNPYQTFSKGCSVLAAGDTLYARGGTYSPAPGAGNSMIADATFGASGTSWTNFILVAGYPGETVIMKPTNGARVITFTSRSYIEFRDLIMDGTSITSDVVKITQAGANPSTSTASFIRLRRCEVRKAPTGANHLQGVLITQDSSTSHDTAKDANGCEILNCILHDNGTGDQLSHGLYVESANHLIDGNTSYRNGGNGIQFYVASGSEQWCVSNVIRNNFCRDNDLVGVGGAGIIVVGLSNQVYNNVCVRNGIGIQTAVDDDARSSGTLVYNNTCYKNGYSADGWGFYNSNQANTTTFKNNIAWTNGQNKAGTQNYHSGSILTQTNNLNFPDGNTDPKFRSVAGDDYRLLSTSPAIDAGTDLSSVFTTDADGNRRPFSAAWDEGAYEYSVATNVRLTVGIMSAAGTFVGV